MAMAAPYRGCPCGWPDATSACTNHADHHDGLRIVRVPVCDADCEEQQKEPDFPPAPSGLLTATLRAIRQASAAKQQQQIFSRRRESWFGQLPPGVAWKPKAVARRMWNTSGRKR